MNEDEKGGGKVTDQQLREAEAGLVRLLHAKRFPREWIERHAPEAMAQARAEFAVRLAAGRDDDTVNLLVVIGYRRAIKVLRSQKSAPPTTSLETVFHLADEQAVTPEEEAIRHDREERVAKAISHLPERERQLMALVYFEQLSIRAAGRRLGWGKSVANRHHQAALDRLRAMLDRSLLASEIAIPAFVADRHRSTPGALLVWIEGAAETLRELASLGAGRIGGALEAGNAAALGGAGRAAGGVCGAVVVACIAGTATGVVGPGLDALAPGHTQQPRRPSLTNRIGETSPPEDQAGAETLGAAPGAEPRSTTQGQGAGDREAPRRIPARARPVPEERSRRARVAAPSATPKQTVEEFGVESSSDGEATPPASEAPTENTTISPRATPQAQPSASGSPSASSGGSSGSGGGGEFGM
jgi:RNA polymerase sigma factor (sigma-70 family)